MNESDLAVDEAADKDLLRFGDGSQDRIYASTFWVRPPTAPDRLAGNSLAKAGCACFGRGEDDATRLQMHLEIMHADLQGMLRDVTRPPPVGPTCGPVPGIFRASSAVIPGGM